MDSYEWDGDRDATYACPDHGKYNYEDAYKTAGTGIPCCPECKLALREVDDE